MFAGAVGGDFMVPRAGALRCKGDGTTDRQLAVLSRQIKHLTEDHLRSRIKNTAANLSGAQKRRGATLTHPSHCTLRSNTGPVWLSALDSTLTFIRLTENQIYSVK